MLSLNEIPILREEEVYDLRNEADNLEEVENPLDQCRIGANEGILIPTVPCEINEENITVVPGEGLKQISILTDKHCEEHIHIYSQLGSLVTGGEVKGREGDVSPFILNYDPLFENPGYAPATVIKLYAEIF